jgi:hypothetical protein
LSIPCPLVFIGAFLMLFPLFDISPSCTRYWEPLLHVCTLIFSLLGSQLRAWYPDRFRRSGNPESRDLGVRGIGWLQMFGRWGVTCTMERMVTIEMGNRVWSTGYDSVYL